MTSPSHNLPQGIIDHSYLVYVFTDPLGIQPAQLHVYGEGTAQPACDRLWLMVRQFRYPVFHDPTLAPNVVHVTRFDPENMRPIEPANLGVSTPENLAAAARSEYLRPCIYVAEADFIRALVARGNPPVFS